jgi:hypothetical protein
MAFQDNAGTIVLDAVTTDIGRKRLAEGTFRITKFAFGDDEIDYAKVEDNSGTMELPTPSEYPILEAHADPNAVINHGLLAFDRSDLFFLPILKTNELPKISNAARANPPQQGTRQSGSFYYMAVNGETRNKLINRFGADSDAYVLEPDSRNDYKIIIESGIDGTITTEQNSVMVGANYLPRDTNARDSYILSTNLLDNYFNIYADGRFVTRVLSPGTGAKFANTTDDTARINFGTLQQSTPITGFSFLDHFQTFCVDATPNLIFNSSGDGLDIELSAFNGPRGAVTALNFDIDSALTSTSSGSSDYKYTTYGTASINLFDNGDLYDYIDTTVMVEGATSQATIQLPLRLIRYAGT